VSREKNINKVHSGKPKIYLSLAPSGQAKRETMDIRTLIKNLVIGFIPLFVFIAADEFFCRRFGEARGTQYALYAAIAMGIGQAIFIFVREKRLDKMVLLDTGLIIVLGGVSLFSGNDIFFKLKPAFVEFIMVLILGIVAFLNPRLLIMMTGRYMPDMEWQDVHVKMMQRSAMGMFALFFLHTLSIVYSAFFLSKEAWAFISGGLFYILAGVYFLFLFITGRIKRRKLMRQYYGGRIVELKDEKGRSLGVVPEELIRNNPRAFGKASRIKRH
jgi:intracellular septation protein A